MRSFLVAAFQLASCLALPVPKAGVVAGSREVQGQQQQQHHHHQAPEVLKYSHDKADVEFSIACPGCLSTADEALVFDFQALSTAEHSVASFILNNHRFDSAKANSPNPSHAIPVFDASGDVHTVTLYWSISSSEDGSQTIRFTVVAIDAVADPEMGFSIDMDVDQKNPRLSRLTSTSASDVICFSPSEDSFSVMDLPSPPAIDAENAISSFNITSELEYLRHLEVQAAQLRMQISEKKAVISEKLRQNREKLCLKHLIKECDGVVCAARVVAQRLCDKLGLNVDPAFGFPKEALASTQQHMSSNEKSNFLHSINSTSYTVHGLNLPLILTKNGSTSALHALGLPEPPHPVVYVLQVLAGAIGLTSLWLLIKNKCISARTRAERLADREERRNKRTYRRAARRAIMRKRWDAFVDAINCFGRKEEPRIEDYEEKRALILQDAFLEQDLEEAGRGDIMEAEIRELRYAHEIVSSLIRVDENHYGLAAPIHDPPPPLVPLPYTPVTRSRASSHTLPSYTSESLPDYTSRYSRDRRLSGSTVGFTPSTSDVEGRRTPDPSKSEHSGSSVLDMSPRPSAETLRTRQSGETQAR